MNLFSSQPYLTSRSRWWPDSGAMKRRLKKSQKKIKITMMTCGTCDTTSRADRQPFRTSQYKPGHAECTPQLVPASIIQESKPVGFQESNNIGEFFHLTRWGAVVPAFEVVPPVKAPPIINHQSSIIEVVSPVKAPPVSFTPLLALSSTASTLHN